MSDNPSSTLPHGSQLPGLAAVGPLRLRVIGTARNGQTVELAAQRVTIGSAPTCTLRLRSQGVRPLQCLIVRGPNGSTARSLSADTLLNGQRFRDERLHPGDRLQVGSIELEVCDDGAMALPASNHAADRNLAGTVKRPTRGRTPEAAHWLQLESSRPQEILARIQNLELRFSQLHALEVESATSPSGNPETANPETTNPETAHRLQLIAQLDQANQRHELVHEELNRLAAERDALRTRCEELSRSHHDAENRLLQLQTEVAERGAADRSQEVLESHPTAAADWSQRHAELMNEIQQLQRELTRRELEQQALEQARTGLETSLSREQKLRAALERQLLEQTSQVSELRTRCDELRSAAESRPSELTAELPHLRQERQWLAEQFAASNSSDSSSSDSSKRCDNERSDTALLPGEAVAAQLEQNPAGLPFAEDGDVGSAPTQPDGNAVFARLLRAGIWKESADEIATMEEFKTEITQDSELESSESCVEAREQETTGPSGLVTPDDAPATSMREDDSIDFYMQRLMQRVRGESAPNSGLLVRVVNEPQAPLTEVPIAAAPRDIVVLPNAVDVLTESEYQPRSQAPEVNSKLAAMRALANDSRHEQFLSHAKRTWISKSQSLLFGSLAGVATTIASFLLLDIYSKLAAVGLVAGLSATGYGIARVFQSRRHLFDELSLKPSEPH